MNGFKEISLDINVGNFENMFQQVFAKWHLPIKAWAVIWKFLNISSSGCLKMFESKEIEVFGFFKKPRRMGGSHEITCGEPEVLRSWFDRFLEVLRIATIH